MWGKLPRRLSRMYVSFVGLLSLLPRHRLVFMLFIEETDEICLNRARTGADDSCSITYIPSEAMSSSRKSPILLASHIKLGQRLLGQPGRIA